jgi:glyoxylate/hydroxypyruvate reductase A
VHAQRAPADVPVAVLGRGRMGQAVAARLSACGFPVAAWGRTAAPPTVPAPAGDIVETAGDAALLPLLARSRIVINVLPLTPATWGLLDQRCFAAMPPGAALVNFGRGAHVIDAHLLAALDCGHLAHAVLDVFQIEPLPPGHRFWSHPAVTVLPHAAALTDPRSATAVVVAQVEALRAGRPLRHLVDRRRGY